MFIEVILDSVKCSILNLYCCCDFNLALIFFVKFVIHCYLLKCKVLYSEKSVNKFFKRTYWLYFCKWKPKNWIVKIKFANCASLQNKTTENRLINYYTESLYPVSIKFIMSWSSDQFSVMWYTLIFISKKKIITYFRELFNLPYVLSSPKCEIVQLFTGVVFLVVAVNLLAFYKTKVHDGS